LEVSAHTQDHEWDYFSSNDVLCVLHYVVYMCSSLYVTIFI